MKQFMQEPRWTEWDNLRHARVPSGLRDWLCDQTSLTARLKSASGGDFRVRLLKQNRGRVLCSEQQILAMKPGEIAIIREVQLICKGMPWVFARTVIPMRSLRGAARRLTLLGERPLGEVLFADPHMRRGCSQMAQVDFRHHLFSAAMGSDRARQAIWGRRSLFRLSGQPLLVNEIFLPALPVSD